MLSSKAFLGRPVLAMSDVSHEQRTFGSFFRHRGLEGRTQTLEQLGQQRWQDAERGTPAYGPVMNELKGGEAQFLVDYHDYYRTPRGFHPRAVNSNGSWTITNPLSFMNMPLLTYIAEISPRPVLFVHGENAHSRYFSETAFAAAKEPKELMCAFRPS